MIRRSEFLQAVWRRITWVTSAITSGIFRVLEPGTRVAAVRFSMPAVIICYTCRRRVSAEEIAQGLHNHSSDSSKERAAASKSPKRVSDSANAD